MADFNPAASGDDGYDDSGFVNNNVDLRFGNISAGNARSFVRFPSITIPAGSTINSCIVTFSARFSDTGVTCNVNCYFQNADNPVAPTTAGEMDTAFAAATGAVAWNAIGAWTYPETTNAITPDLSSILQTVVNRGGWASGNAVLFLIQDNSSSLNAFRRPYSFDGDTSFDAVLTVTWTEGGGTPLSVGYLGEATVGGSLF